MQRDLRLALLPLITCDDGPIEARDQGSREPPSVKATQVGPAHRRRNMKLAKRFRELPAARG
jgi:hypothetical protein